jgi:RNA polymerase sigma-70 factor, ECF subfamily
MPPRPEDCRSESLTSLLNRRRSGNTDAEIRAISKLYPELHRIAVRYMQRERQGCTLQPTALVNEAYIRLVGQAGMVWKDRAHFLGIAARIMRQILVDHARSRAAEKRGGNGCRVTLDELTIGVSATPVDVLAVDQAIEELSALDARQARVVELDFFGGLSFAEIASFLQIGVRTAKRDWSMARAWLATRLSAA